MLGRLVRHIILLIFISGQIFAQEINDIGIQQRLELWIENNRGNGDIDEITQLLQYYQETPLAINSASIEELDKFPLINLIQSFNLHQYIKRNGALFSYYEMIEIKGYDRNLIELLTMFTTLKVVRKRDIPLKEAFKYTKHKILVYSRRELELRDGYKEEDGFLGSANYFQTQYLLKASNRIRSMITLEKDPGEMFNTKQSPYLFDHLSGFVEYKSQDRIIKKVVVGNYHVKNGLGLNQWTGFNMGKQINPDNNLMKGTGIRAYSGNEENNVYSGLATQTSYKKHNIDAYVSHRKVDASIDDAGFYSISRNGNHNTQSLLDRKNNLRKTDVGVIYKYKKENDLTTLSYNFSHFSLPKLNRDELYVENIPEGRNIHHISLSGITRLRNTLLSYEIASINLSRYAFKGNIFINKEYFDWFGEVSFYQNGYVASNATFVDKNTSNGVGEFIIFNSFSFPILDRFKIAVSNETYQSTWVNFDKKILENGSRIASIFTYDDRYNQVSLRFRYNTDKKFDTRTEYKIGNRKYYYKVRFEYNQVENDNAYLLGSSFFTSIHEEKLKLYFGAYYFNAEKWNNRFYLYEPDMINTFFINQLYGNGVRWYTKVLWDINETYRLISKIERTKYPREFTKGTGDSFISSKHFTTLKLQLQIKL